MKDEAKSATNNSASCCGAEMERRMRAFFASLDSEDAEGPGPCADWMKEMMRSCFRPSVDREPTEQ